MTLVYMYIGRTWRNSVDMPARAKHRCAPGGQGVDPLDRFLLALPPRKGPMKFLWAIWSKVDSVYMVKKLLPPKFKPIYRAHLWLYLTMQYACKTDNSIVSDTPWRQTYVPWEIENSNPNCEQTIYSGNMRLVIYSVTHKDIQADQKSHS